MGERRWLEVRLPKSCLPPALRPMRGGSPGENSEAYGRDCSSRDFRSLACPGWQARGDFGSLRQRLQQPGPPSFLKTRRSAAEAEAAVAKISQVLPATCPAPYAGWQSRGELGGLPDWSRRGAGLSAGGLAAARPSQKFGWTPDDHSHYREPESGCGMSDMGGVRKP